MIDFATLQGVTIPEGVVTQIESGGVVLWSAAKPAAMVTVTIKPKTTTVPSKPEYAYVEIGGVVYDGTATVTVSVPIGTIATCYGKNNVLLNGVSMGGLQTTYEHEITTETDFGIVSNEFVGFVYITEK